MQLKQGVHLAKSAILNNGKCLNFLFNNMRLTVNATSGAAWCYWWLCRKFTESFIRNNDGMKISSEPDAVINRATSGSRAIGSRPLTYAVVVLVKQGAG